MKLYSMKMRLNTMFYDCFNKFSGRSFDILHDLPLFVSWQIEIQRIHTMMYSVVMDNEKSNM